MIAYRGNAGVTGQAIWRRVQVRAWILVVVAAMTLAIGCGSDDSEEASTAAKVEPAATQSGLSQQQFDELEQLLVSMLPLDEIDVTKNPAKARSVLDDAAEACAQVAGDDALLAAMVDGCERTMATLASTSPDCTSAKECGQALSDLADTVDELISTVRDNEPTIAAAVTDDDCEEVLLSAEQVDAFEPAVPVYRRAAAAISSEDPAAYAGIEQDMTELQASLDDVPTNREQLEQFRRSCRP
jgi:hypothetical protein